MRHAHARSLRCLAASFRVPKLHACAQMYAFSIASTQLKGGPLRYQLKPELMLQPPFDMELRVVRLSNTDVPASAASSACRPNTCQLIYASVRTFRGCGALLHLCQAVHCSDCLQLASCMV